MSIDLSRLAAPTIVEPLDYETLLAQRKESFVARLPEMAPVMDLESEPVVVALEEAAYLDLNLRTRVNDATRACMLAYARGADLEHLAALLGVQRLLLDPGNSSANPPLLPTYESDDRLRARTQMSLEGTTVAGSSGAYIFHALSASARVRDVAVDSPAPGDVRVTVLAIDNGGIPDADLLAAVLAHLSADERRPLTDTVIVEPATLIDFQIMATLHLYPGPSGAPVLAAARTVLDAYIASTGRLGYDITRSGLFAALHQPGVRQVVLDSPAEDIIIAPREAARCTAVTMTEGDRDV